MSRFMGELRGKMQSAFSSGSLFGFFIISFTAVGRESFETAIFLQGLSADSLGGTAWGAGLGLVVMTVFVFVVRRVGFVLPMKTLFNASTVLLVATALMLVGKGMHGLEELGVLTMRPLPFFSVEALGVFADGWTLVPQAVLLGVALVLWRVSKQSFSWREKVPRSGG
jgi:high-affinity iron transporter